MHRSTLVIGASIVLAAIIVSATTATLFRYDLEGVHRGNQWPTAYVMDRWNGTLRLCDANACVPEVPMEN